MRAHCGSIARYVIFGAVIVAAPSLARAQRLIPDRATVFGAVPVHPVADGVGAAQCVEIFSEWVSVSRDSTGAVSVDPAACDEDAIPREALDPGSGMVLVSAHGVELHLPPEPPPEVSSLPEWLDRTSYPTRSGSAVRERVAVAINPPPSTRSPR